MFAVVGPAVERGGDHGGERSEDDGHDGPGEPRRLLHAEQVDGGERDDGADGERAGEVGRGVGAERQRHRRAAGGLADDERPTRRGTPTGGRAAPGRRRRCRPTPGRARRAAPRTWRCSRRRAAAMASPISSPPPAAAAAGPIAANTPAPIIEPRPMITASKVPSWRDSRLGGCVASSSVRCGPATAHAVRRVGGPAVGRWRVLRIPSVSSLATSPLVGSTRCQPAGWKSSIRLPDGILDEDLGAAGAGDDVVAERDAFAAQPVDLGWRGRRR